MNIGLGLAALGRPGYINLGHADDLGADYDVAAMRQHTHDVLDAAWQLGIRYFDAARSYGKAEEFLASWISDRGYGPDQLSVGSKWGYTYTADWQVQTPEGVEHEVKRHELDVLERQFEISQSNFGDHLKLYQIHSATMQSGVLENDAVLNRLAEMGRSGIEIGLSVSGPQQSQTIEKALTIEVDDKCLFSSVQATWNLLETSAGNALAQAHHAGLKVIVKESLANGRLTARNADPSFQAERALLQSTADRLNTTIDALAIAAAIEQPWSTTVLSGAATVPHLQSNVNALKVQRSEECERQLASLKQPAQKYWASRGEMAWN